MKMFCKYPPMNSNTSWELSVWNKFIPLEGKGFSQIDLCFASQVADSLWPSQPVTWA